MKHRFCRWVWVSLGLVAWPLMPSAELAAQERPSAEPETIKAATGETADQAASEGTAEANKATPSPMEFFIAYSRAQLRGSGFERHAATVAGQPMVWWQKGSGPTLIMIHGVSDQAGTWFQVASALADDHRLLLVDLPGHGESGPAAGPLPMSTVLDGFGAWLERHGTPDDGSSVTLVGNSMGAWVALATVLEPTHLVERVVMVNGGPLRVDSGDLDLLPADREEARRLMAALRDAASPPIADPVLDDLVRRAPHGQVQRMLDAQQNLDSHLMDDGAKGLGRIKTPVDILWGVSDRYLGRDYAQRLLAGLPRARLTWIAACGHLPQAECPQAFAKGLRDVLSKAAASAAEEDDARPGDDDAS